MYNIKLILKKKGNNRMKNKVFYSTLLAIGLLLSGCSTSSPTASEHPSLKYSVDTNTTNDLNATDSDAMVDESQASVSDLLDEYSGDIAFDSNLEKILRVHESVMEKLIAHNRRMDSELSRLSSSSLSNIPSLSSSNSSCSTKKAIKPVKKQKRRVNPFFAYLNNNASAVNDGFKGRAIVKASSLNSRANSSEYTCIVHVYSSGEFIRIIETKGGWSKTNRGYVKSEYIKNLSQVPTMKVVGTVDKMSVRSSPSFGNNVISKGSIKKGETFTVFSPIFDRRWYKLKGRAGYVHKSTLKKQ
jgi:hypothetical protein